MRGKGEPREARRRHAHPRPQDDPRVRPQGGGARLRLPVVGRDAARPVPAAGGGRHVAPARIELGTSIAVAFPRSPMVLAHIAWDLQKASGGRFILGLGSQVKGHNERRFSVKWEAPAPRLREVVQALRAIWDCWQNGTKLNFKGQFYRFDLMTPFFSPGPIEHPHDPDLHRRREPVHVPARRRGVRRPARAPVPQPQVPARARAAGGERGPRQVGPRREATSPTRRRASWSWATPRPSRRQARRR